MKHLDILNIYKFNLYQILNIMCCARTNSIPETLQNKFKILEHNYSARYSEYNFKEPNLVKRRLINCSLEIFTIRYDLYYLILVFCVLKVI